MAQDRKYTTKYSDYRPGTSISDRLRKGSSKQALKKVSSGAAGELLRRSGRKMGPGPKDALTMRESLLKKAGLKKPKKKKY